MTSAKGCHRNHRLVASRTGYPPHRYARAVLQAAVVLSLVAAAAPDSARAAPAAWSTGVIKGVTWGWVARRGEYSSPAAADSMQKLAETGATWVCIAFAATAPTYDAADFRWGDDAPDMASDADIRRAIQLARDNGLKVILKPTINCGDGTWRAWIRFFRPLTDAERAEGATGVDDPWGETPTRREGMAVDEQKWSTWWRHFSNFLIHYAELAADENVEVLCLGCEMNSTEADEARWRQTIAAVRTKYSGLLTYNSNHGRERDLAWWDAVDLISISAYYEVPPPAGVTVEEAAKTATSKQDMLARLQGVKSELAALSAAHDKPILFIEAGVTNVRGGARYPWSHPNAHPESPLDEAEQANYYAAHFETFWGEPWFMGFAWWDWPATLYPAGRADENRGFCIFGKQAEEVLKEWYAKPTPARIRP
jgi:hypothetical protein